MKTYTFKVVVEPDEDAKGNPAWHAYCPALESKGAATSGRTREEALKHINEVVQLVVDSMIEHGELPRGKYGGCSGNSGAPCNGHRLIDGRQLRAASERDCP